MSVSQTSPPPVQEAPPGSSFYDVILVGAGFTGMTLAFLCKQAGLRTALIDCKNPLSSPGKGDDGRVTAISAGSRTILETAGLWSCLEKKAEPILDIHVTAERGGKGLFYRQHDLGCGPMGYMIENTALQKGWAEALRAEALGAGLSPKKAEIVLWAPVEIESFHFDSPHAHLVMRQNGSRPFRLFAPLIVGADGRESRTRTAAGIGVLRHDYRQTALVFTVAHDQPHGGMAEEWFLESGPLAVLPMGDHPEHGHQSGVVWTMPNAEAGRLSALNREDFDRRLAEAISGVIRGESDDQGGLPHRGALHAVGRRWLYPLSLQVASSRTARRLALVGDAAQSIHPLAGQGLNLGLRDGFDLADTLCAHHRLGLDIGAAPVLGRYARKRRLDAWGLIMATDGLNRLFSNSLPGLRQLRVLGLELVDSLSPVKRWLQKRAMGYGRSSEPMIDRFMRRHEKKRIFPGI